eukprot:7915829-Alexandrium_andersonii.AAC.1
MPGASTDPGSAPERYLGLARHVGPGTRAACCRHPSSRLPTGRLLEASSREQGVGAEARAPG